MGQRTNMSVANSGDGKADPKLPLGTTIGLAYSSYFQNFIDVLRISWLYLLLVVPLIGATSWQQMSWFSAALANLGPGTHLQAIPARPVELTVLQIMSSLATFFAGVSIAVAWHRRLLLNEPPRFSGSNVGAPSLWRYIGVGLVICLIIALPALAIIAPIYLMLPRGVANTPNVAIFVAIPFLYIFGFVILLRLSLLLPARAVDNISLTFKEVWNRTRGNTWRLFWGVVACFAPPLLIVQLGVLILGGFPNPAKLANGEMVHQWVIDSVVITSYSMLVTPIWVGFLSYAYRFLVVPAPRDVR
jgi:hypothetical protein